MNDDDEWQSAMMDMQRMHEERERMSEAALIECARMGLAEDHLRQLCMECGIGYERVVR